ncbi:MATE efflux family protein [compost metagenome]
MKPDARLTTGPIGRTLLLFSLPVLGSNILQSLNASINSVWVGRFLGEAALTATSNANIILFFLLGMYFYNFVMMTLRGAGDSRTPFWFMLLSVVLDVVLNPVLIFGVGPLPALGIAGSALATLIAQLASLAAMMVLLYRRRHFLLLHRGQLALLRPDPAILRALVLKGLPMGLQMVVISSSAIVMMALVNAYGSQTTAAYGVASQLWTYVQMPALAVGASVSSMVAQNVGAGLWQRVSRITRVGLMFNVAMTGALVGLIYLFNRHSLGIFLGGDSVAIGIAQHINVVVLWSFILFGFTIVIFGTVRATGAVMAPLVILFLSMWVIRLPFAWVLGERIGADAIWWSFPLGSVVSLGLAISYYQFGGWRRSHILPAGGHPGEAVGQAPDTSMGTPCEDVVEQVR